MKSLPEILLLTAVAVVVISADDPLNPKEQKEKATNLPPCKACSTLAASFKLGMDNTRYDQKINHGQKKTITNQYSSIWNIYLTTISFSRGKHAGGDAAWEEEKLRSYKTSEVRLVEIQENLCQEVRRGQTQCHNMANDHEHLLEEWFTHKQTEEPDVHKWLCIDQLKVCCPEGHFGAECKQCTDCHGNGKCKGDGTRKGNGKCNCDAGYAGDDCNQCANGYYEAFRDEKKLLCSACHKACTKDGGCKGAGPKGK